MLPFGHSSAGYLISQIPRKNQKPFNRWEIGLVIIAANIFDIDYLLPVLVGLPMGTHHYLPTHTPLIGIIYWLILFLILRGWVRFPVLVAMGVAMASHFVLDDLGYWLGVLGLSSKIRPQIFWLYPFDSRLSAEVSQAVNFYKSRPWSQNNVFVSYLTERPMLFYCELLLVFGAITVWIKKTWTNVLTKAGGKKSPGL